MEPCRTHQPPQAQGEFCSNSSSSSASLVAYQTICVCNWLSRFVAIVDSVYAPRSMECSVLHAQMCITSDWLYLAGVLHFLPRHNETRCRYHDVKITAESSSGSALRGVEIVSAGDARDTD